MAAMRGICVTALVPLVLACALAGVSPGWAVAQDSTPVAETQPADSQPAKVSLLRAEIYMERTLLTPAQPAWARFTLSNPTDEPIEIPAIRGADGAGPISLPLALVLGDASQPALHITLDARTDSIKPTIAPPAPDGTMLLAPRGSIGTQLDLRTLSRDAIYTGKFKLEWRPPIGKGPVATIEFAIETRKKVVIRTDFGSMTFNLMYDKAPRNVENFLELVRDKFYDQKSFHRLMPGFILQGGSPDGRGLGQRADGKTVPAEIHDGKFERGTLAMALKNLPNGALDPASASCQFFIALDRVPSLDGKYTIIGQAADEASLRTLDAIAAQPVNENGRPLQPISISFITLMNAEEIGAKRLELIKQP
jgi:cyclophilin family peptidyl-prolyl cis-trans isomerase